MRNPCPLWALLLLAACGPYPDDTGGTSERIARTGVVRIGLSELHPADVPAARAFIAKLADRLNARAETSAGPAERELAELEAGKLDLVLGDFAEDIAVARRGCADRADLRPQRRRSQTRASHPWRANGENRFDRRGRGRGARHGRTAIERAPGHPPEISGDIAAARRLEWWNMILVRQRGCGDGARDGIEPGDEDRLGRGYPRAGATGGVPAGHALGSRSADDRFHYGYDRVNSLGFLVAAVALGSVGLFLPRMG